MASRKETIIYVTREIERALGATPNERYYIVTNRTPYGEKIRQQYPEYVIFADNPGEELLGTGDLLKHPRTEELVAELSKSTGARPYILVFKNTARIEPLARDHGWTIVNPPATTSEKIENKISQVTWLGELENYLPSHRLEFMRNIRWNNKPFVIQWAHGHTGAGTILINSEEELKAIQAKFPERRTRVTEYIRGPSFTVNVIVTPDKIVSSSVSYQITGLAPFTDIAFATIGNDWGVVKSILSEGEIATIQNLVQELGAKMQKEFWRGLFGIDIIKDTERNRLFLIEVNARQPASTTFESALQEAKRAKGATGLTTMEAHIAALLGQPVTQPLIEVTDGAQIVQRVTKTLKSVPEDATGSLELAGYNVISYENTKDNEDLLRIQSDKGLLASHDTLNENGQEVVKILKVKK